MAAPTPPVFAVRGSEGLKVINGPPSYEENDVITRSHAADASRCKTMSLSNNGAFIAWTDGQSLFVVEFSSGKLVFHAEVPKLGSVILSPNGTYLAGWEQYISTDIPGGMPNMYFWNVKSGKKLKDITQKKQSQWWPQWSADEKVCGRMANQEVHFFEEGNFDVIAHKMHVQKVISFSLSPSKMAPYHVAAYVPGSKGQPSFVRLYRYPRFDGQQAIIANKSFFKADRVLMYWNKKGTAMLVMAVIDVDSSNTSYYGEQKLHYIDTGGASSTVSLGKNGPIYHVEWSPTSTEFCAVYGFMPAKATLYSTKCEPLFDFGEGPRNAAYFSPFGNMLVLAGFGNLKGQLEFWDMEVHQLMCKCVASDSTFMQWCPDGEHLLTATTSPRLRVGNGYRLWHYTGSLVHEHKANDGEELFEVAWQPDEEKFKKKPISYKAVRSIAAPAPTSVPTYRPPAARGQQSTFKLHDEVKPNKQQTAVVQDVNKKIKNLKKKLDQISKLKEQQAAGKTLEKNQLEKLKSEEDILNELAELEL